MQRIEFTIKGIAPILFNAWTKEAKEKLDKGSTGGKMSIDERIEEAGEKVYRDGENLVVPAQNLEACIVNGARKAGLKRGRAGLAPYLEATVFCETRALSLGRTEADGIHEVIGRRGGNACVIRRPILNEWGLSGVLTVADDRMDANQIKQALEEAGLLVGLCDWRPKYGRFVVTRFAKLNGALPD